MGGSWPLQKAAEDGIDPEAAGDCEAYRGFGPRAEPAHFVIRAGCSAHASLRGPFLTYPPSRETLGAAIGAALEAIVASPVAFGPAEL